MIKRGIGQKRKRNLTVKRLKCADTHHLWSFFSLLKSKYSDPFLNEMQIMDQYKGEYNYRNIGKLQGHFLELLWTKELHKSLWYLDAMILWISSLYWIQDQRQRNQGRPTKNQGMNQSKNIFSSLPWGTRNSLPKLYKTHYKRHSIHNPKNFFLTDILESSEQSSEYFCFLPCDKRLHLSTSAPSVVSIWVRSVSGLKLATNTWPVACDSWHLINGWNNPWGC